MADKNVMQWLRGNKAQASIERVTRRVFLRNGFQSYDDRIVEFIRSMIDINFDKNYKKVKNSDSRIDDRDMKIILESSTEKLTEHSANLAHKKEKNMVELEDVMESYLENFCSIFPIC